MKSLFVFINVIIFSHSLYSQEVFQRSYGGPGNEYGRAVIECSNGGYLIVGSTNSYYNPSTDVYLLRVDSSGEYLWGRNIGASNKIDWGVDLAEDADGNFIIAGYTDDSPSGSYDGLLIKTNSEGEVMWKKTFGGDDWDFIESMALNDLGEVVLAGSKTVNGVQKGWVLKTDNDGEIIWEKLIDSNSQLTLSGIDSCIDQNIVFVGYTNNSLLNTKTNVSGKMDQNGNILWVSTYPEFGNIKTGRCICGINNEVVTASTAYNSEGLPYSFVSALNWFTGLPTGKTIFPNNYKSLSKGIAQKSDGTIILVNGIEGFGFEYFDSGIYFLDRISDTLYVANSAILGGWEYDALFDVSTTSDGGIIAVGETNSFGNGYQVHLCKLDSLGNRQESNTDFLDLTTSINPQIDKSSNITIFPNPAQDFIQVDGEQSVYTHFEILDSSSKLFLSGNLKDQPNGIDIRSLPSGLFILKLYESGELISISRFVKLL